jgi:NADH-quinone oxidoreductase subunit K
VEIVILLTSAVMVLLISYLTAISSRDLIRLLISLELMFGSIFLALLPLFSIPEMLGVAFGIAIIVIFTSCSELLILIASIILLDRVTRDVTTDSIYAGGEIV